MFPRLGEASRKDGGGSLCSHGIRFLRGIHVLHQGTLCQCRLGYSISAFGRSCSVSNSTDGTMAYRQLSKWLLIRPRFIQHRQNSQLVSNCSTHIVVHWVTIAVWTFADKAYMKWIVIAEDLQGEAAGCRPADTTSVSCLPSLGNTPLVSQSFHQEWSTPSC
jgi:hypothetical protein